MNKFIKFHCLPFHMKVMFLEACLLSAYYRFLILHKPFKEISKKIGLKGYETMHEIVSNVVPNEIGNVVDCICNHTPWESKCLVRALTARKMLVRRGYACTLYMGVKVSDSGKMEAHAWLRCGNLFVTGGTGNEYTVTGIFGDCPQL